MAQSSLFDLPTADEARAARDQGMELVDSNASEAWKQKALQSILLYLRTHEVFFIDDFWRDGGFPPGSHDKAIGPLIRRAATNGWMVKTNEARPSVRSHMTPKPVWKSLVYVEAS